VNQRAGPGARARRQVVGEYVGEPAGQAAQAVRRAGLRPGLDRSFGCAPELVGQVVAQEPPAGGELPRNGLVKLFVAAPGAGPQETVEPAANVPPRPSEDEPSPRARRRRKRGLARGAPRIAPSPPPAPVLSAQRPQRDPRTDTAAAEITEELQVPPSPGVDAGEAEEAAPPAPADYGADEQFVIHAADVFAGHTNPAWQRVYPLRRGSQLGVARVRSYFGGRSPLVKAAVVLVAVWMVVALAVALAGSPASRHAAHAVSPPVRLGTAGRRHAPDRVQAHPGVRTGGGRAHVAVGPRRRAVLRRPPHPSITSSAPVQPERSSATPAPPPEAAPPAVSRPAPAQAAPPASTPAPPARQQTTGGLFSP